MKKAPVRQLSSVPVIRQVSVRGTRSSRAGELVSVLGYAGFVVAAAAGIYLAAVIAAGFLLVKKDVPEIADAIVVLGGDGRPRAERAAALWNEGFAPSILVTGYGDCNFIRTSLIGEGVDPAAITTECLSRSTWDNARFSRPVLAGMRVQRAILVTSWFHSRRAVTRFRSFMPGIHWMSVPAERTKTYQELVLDADGVQILKEYVKIVAYDLRSRIFAETGADGAAPKTGRLP